jgi:hypothetical protein
MVKKYILFICIKQLFFVKHISKTTILVWSIFTPLAQQLKAANLGQGFMEYEIFLHHI